MRFSMNSYLLGVGTVVGALAFGFGGGILLTKTAIKDTPTGPSRIERVARQEPAPAAPPVQVTEAKPVPVARPDPAPAAQPAGEPPPIQAAAEPKPEAKPVAEAARQEPAKAAEPVRQVEAPRQAERQAEQPVKQADAPKQIEQREIVQETTAREQRRAERERRAERRIARERYYADRKARAVAYARVRQRPIEIQEQPARPELAFEREEPRQPNLFEGLFGRPAEAAPGERE
jgi:outer membrane biosynthesis protein TonB